MHAPLLILSLLSADDVPEITAPQAEPAVEDAPPPALDATELWPGEFAGRKVAFGVGPRVHTGVLESVNVARLLLQSDIAFFIGIRVFGHHELRVGASLALGWPDTVAGETNLSFRFHLTPRFSIGAGAFTYWGFWSMRGGVELPIGLRFGPNRKHEIVITARGSAGLYNNTITFAWYDFKALKPAFTADIALGYSAIF